MLRSSFVRVFKSFFSLAKVAKKVKTLSGYLIDKIRGVSS